MLTKYLLCVGSGPGPGGTKGNKTASQLSKEARILVVETHSYNMQLSVSLFGVKEECIYNLVGLQKAA